MSAGLLTDTTSWFLLSGRTRVSHPRRVLQLQTSLCSLRQTPPPHVHRCFLKAKRFRLSSFDLLAFGTCGLPPRPQQLPGERSHLVPETLTEAARPEGGAPLLLSPPLLADYLQCGAAHT